MVDYHFELWNNLGYKTLEPLLDVKAQLIKLVINYDNFIWLQGLEEGQNSPIILRA